MFTNRAFPPHAEDAWRRHPKDAVTAVAEVVLAFAAVHLLYRAIQRFTVVGAWEAAAGTNFIPGSALIAVSLIALWAGRRCVEPYGLSLRRWPHDLNLGLAFALVVIAIGAAAWGVTGLRDDPSRPPEPHRPPTLVRTLGGPVLGLLAFATLLAWFRMVRKVEPVRPAAGLAVLMGMLALPLILAAWLHRPPPWPTVLWNFCCAGVGEELFFRGYVQGRVDVGFGRPWRVLGCQVGPGIVVSSLLFGAIHALNTVDYFRCHWDVSWWYGLQNCLVGLLYAYLRARSGSVWAGAVTHGLVDVFASVPTLLANDAVPPT